MAEALDYSHARGVVHRDIKPENVMVTREEGAGIRVRVMDFGLARASSESRLTRTGTLIGTLAYLSPEQVAAKEVDGRSDVYALGTVLYECVAGGPPFAARRSRSSTASCTSSPSPRGRRGRRSTRSWRRSSSLPAEGAGAPAAAGRARWRRR